MEDSDARSLAGLAKGLMRHIMRRLKPEFLTLCKYCGSGDVVKYGTYQGAQRWWCKNCNRKFVDADTLPKMKTPIPQIAGAMSAYYGGMSLDEIARHHEQQYGTTLTDAGIYNWIVRFTEDAKRLTNPYIPKVGKVWVADETVLKIGGNNVWFWDIIDAKTRFLLASHISNTRTIKDVMTLMERASKRAGGLVPDIILTDKLAAYLDGIEQTYGANTKHIPIKGITAMLNTNLIERFHGTLKDRTKAMRGFKRIDTARLILDGWLIHYNFFRPHESLGNRTPAEYAGIKLPHKDWTWIVRESGNDRPNGDNKPIARTSQRQKKRPDKRTKMAKVGRMSVSQIRGN